MKTCSSCGDAKPLTAFHAGYRNNVGGVAAACKPCANAARKLRNDCIRAAVDALKTAPCIDCGGKFPAVCMDFDHIADKEFNIGDARANGSSLTRVLKEIEKCELVCANCHRLRTAARRK